MTEDMIRKAASKYGTPLYLFDTDQLIERVKEIKEITGVPLCYAMKANPFLTKELMQHVERIEVCSPGELQICRRIDIPMQKVIFSGVLKERKELCEILSTSRELPLFTAESEIQAELLCGLAQKYEREIEVLLRLTSGNQFGMNEETLLSAVKKIRTVKNVSVKGIHFYSGTQKRSTSQNCKELKMLDALCLKIKEQTGCQIELLEYGPGLSVDYFQDKKREAESLSEELRELCQSIAALQSCTGVTLEMGRFLTAECGIYVTQVRELKENGGVRYCLVDGGMHQLCYDGQVMAMKTPYIRQLPEHIQEKEEVYTVCGALCTVNDVLVRQYPLRGIIPGDYLVFEKTGAYAMTEGMSLFLSRDLPGIVSYSSSTGFNQMREGAPTYPLNMAKPISIQNVWVC